MASNDSYRLLETRVVTGQIEVVTGLRIGGSVETMEISGMDNPILRNPANQQPYLPGSSIKGKLRSLAEWRLQELPLPSGDLVRDCRIDSRTARVFGVSANKDRPSGPTRTLVRDAFLSKADAERFRNGQPITEAKSENTINRLTAMANPRPMERIVPEVRFDFEIVYRIFDLGDGGKTDKDNFEAVLLLAMSLLEKDYLGSAGSRGCGQIRFVTEQGPGVMVNGQHRALPAA